MSARERISAKRETAALHARLTKRHACDCEDCADVRRMNAARG